MYCYKVLLICFYHFVVNKDFHYPPGLVLRDLLDHCRGPISQSYFMCSERPGIVTAVLVSLGDYRWHDRIVARWL